MFRHGDISTETDRGPFLFTLSALLGSLIAAVLILVLGGGHALAIVAGVLLLAVAAAAAAVLFAMTSDRAYIENDTLSMQYMFRRTRVPLSDISRIEYRDDVYSVFDRRDALLGTINARLTGIDRVLNKLDQSGIRFV